MIGIVDYGLGNLAAFENIYRRLGVETSRVRTQEELHRAERLILPGVGAFDWAMQRLNSSGLRDGLERKVLEDKSPVLGVCVGMQMMAEASDEGAEPGLGWIEGRVRRIPEERLQQRTHLPHMGWNDVVPSQGSSLFKTLSLPRFYFLHSYIFEPASAGHVAAVSDYGGEFACAVHRDNIWATQFHPEKSHEWGVVLLKNFAATEPC